MTRHMIEESFLNRDSRVLEPSAGSGGMANLIYEHCKNLVAVELNKGAFALLNKQRYESHNKDFLLLTPDDIGLFTHVIACPPYNTTKHLDHMVSFLDVCGILVALVIEDTLNDHWLKFYDRLPPMFVGPNNEELQCGLIRYSRGGSLVDYWNAHTSDGQFSILDSSQ